MLARMILEARSEGGRPAPGELGGARTGSTAGRSTLRLFAMDRSSMLEHMQARVHFLPADRSVRVPFGTPLIEAVRRAGLPIASACSAEGACGRCGVRLLAGETAVPAASRAEQRVKRRNRIDAALRLACRVEVRGDMTVDRSPLTKPARVRSATATMAAMVLRPSSVS